MQLFCVRSTKLFLLTIIPLILLVAGYSFAWAQVSRQVTVTATVPEKPPLDEPDTTVIFSGVAFPSSEVRLEQDGELAALVTTNAASEFETSLIVDPGSYTFSIQATDPNGVSGRVSSFTLYLSEGSTTTISGIFLSPTITVDKTSVEANTTQTITIDGTTYPNSEINLTLESPGVGAGAGTITTRIAVYTIDADSNGNWEQTFVANELDVGTYEARAQATHPVTLAVSELSNTISFDVVEGEPDECAGAVLGDLNCDGFVNLVDFSIFLFFWNSTNPANPRADINTDGIVDVTDFSIMLFYWTG